MKDDRKARRLQAMLAEVESYAILHRQFPGWDRVAARLDTGERNPLYPIVESSLSVRDAIGRVASEIREDR